MTARRYLALPADLPRGRVPAERCRPPSFDREQRSQRHSRQEAQTRKPMNDDALRQDEDRTQPAAPHDAPGEERSGLQSVLKTGHAYAAARNARRRAHGVATTTGPGRHAGRAVRRSWATWTRPSMFVSMMNPIASSHDGMPRWL